MHLCEVSSGLLLVLLVGLSVASEPDSLESGWIAGTVTDLSGTLFTNATVMVVDTPCGAMTSDNGTYIIKLIEGEYWLQARSLGFPPADAEEVVVTPGDTTWVDFTMGHTVYRYTWNDHMPESTAFRQILVRVMDVDDNSSADLAVYACRSGYQASYCQVTAISENVFSIKVPVDAKKLMVSLPYTQEIHVGVESDNEFPPKITVDFTGYDVIEGTPDTADLFAIARSAESGWTSEEFALSRIDLDYARWGDSRFQRYGLKHVAYYPDSPYADGSWRILLVYRDKIVVLADGIPEVNHPIAFASFHLIHFSPEGRYVLIYDGIGLDDSSGDAVIIDTVAGSQTVFDPSPEMTAILGEPSGCCGIMSFSRATAIADDGSVCILSDGLIRMFDQNGRYHSARVLEYYDYGFTTSEMFITSDGKRILVFSPSDSSTIACILNDDLRVIASGVISDFMVGSLMSQSNIDTSDDLVTIICSRQEEGGTLVFDLQSGVNLYFDEGGRYCSALSADGSIAAYTYIEEPRNIMWEGNSGSSINSHHRVFNTDTGEVLYEYPGEIIDWAVRDIVDLASSGASLLMLNYNTADYRVRLALLSEDGQPIWLGPARRNISAGRAYSTLAAISEDGTRLICSDGRFIQVLEFTEHYLDTAD